MNGRRNILTGDIRTMENRPPTTETVRLTIFDVLHDNLNLACKT